MRKLAILAVAIASLAQAQSYYGQCNGVPNVSAPGVPVTVDQPASIALTKGTCVAFSCSVDVGFFGGAYADAGTNSFVLKAGTIWRFYVQNAAYLNFYPLATGTCFAPTLSP